LRAHILVARGDIAGAVTDVERALELGRESVEHQTLCPALGDYAFCHLEAGRMAESAQAAAELETIVHQGSNDLPHYWFLDLAFAMTELGRGQDVIGLTQAARLQTRWSEAAVLYAQGDSTAAADL